MQDDIPRRIQPPTAANSCQTPNHATLWHGTNATDPVEILQDESGLDFRYGSACLR
jgi:hypothetical protein